MIFHRFSFVSFTFFFGFILFWGVALTRRSPHANTSAARRQVFFFVEVFFSLFFLLKRGIYKRWKRSRTRSSFVFFPLFFVSLSSAFHSSNGFFFFSKLGFFLNYCCCCCIFCRLVLIEFSRLSSIKCEAGFLDEIQKSEGSTLAPPMSRTTNYVSLSIRESIKNRCETYFSGFSFIDFRRGTFRKKN